ncbi:MAG TPA: MarR family transcriptional regulator [Tepidisphaeraceae bacterium]|nr:MarR family transcriptional regulator [Tepidisphaeraceae bacterium]
MRSHRGGLSVPQFRTLVLLESSPTKNLSAVAEFLGVSLPTASRMVTCMVRKGFVHRRECPNDRRQVELVLTSRGAAIMEKSRRATQQEIARELQSLDQTDRDAIFRAMRMLQIVFKPIGKSGTCAGNGDSSTGSAAKNKLSDRS